MRLPYVFCAAFSASSKKWASLVWTWWPILCFWVRTCIPQKNRTVPAHISGAVLLVIQVGLAEQRVERRGLSACGELAQHTHR